ncbi:hypothetical protein PR202_gn00479 [Eleusine coracana subsp. coracana]|uniref:Retrotransposon gag domain-containing protein n=1 Tax=Eleusine coracana subsp. coracana TaxID=191504 RepID=A0AAV5FZP8_ELECO|nr:hypothetical protein PR202_gb29517 [Eleusine coracana subsp. coracana]GJN41144.1 hypothetical protein PR202_gn00479 [Eleusine coracana subsp. coracana]
MEGNLNDAHAVIAQQEQLIGHLQAANGQLNAILNDEPPIPLAVIPPDDTDLSKNGDSGIDFEAPPGPGDTVMESDGDSHVGLTCLFMCQMVQTRRGGENVGDAPGASNVSGNGPLPNAPPMTAMEQLIHNQNEMFRMFMENMNLGDPLEVDNFFRTLESKFALLHCIEQQKPLFAAQQLRGSVSAWWASFTATLTAGHQVTWAEFCTAFHAHHIPAGLMKRKLQEFLNLKQGSRTVQEYARKFNYLAQYASYHAYTDEKKKDCFHSSLTPKLQDRLAQVTAGTFNDLMSAAIVQEDAIRANQEDKKRKHAMGSSSGSAPPKYKLAITSPTGQKFRAAVLSGGGPRPSFSQQHSRFHGGNQQQSSGSHPPQQNNQVVKTNSSQPSHHRLAVKLDDSAPATLSLGARRAPPPNPPLPSHLVAGVITVSTRPPDPSRRIPALRRPFQLSRRPPLPFPPFPGELRPRSGKPSRARVSAHQFKSQPMVFLKLLIVIVVTRWCGKMAANNDQTPLGWEITDGMEFTGMTHLFLRVLRGFGYDVPPTRNQAKDVEITVLNQQIQATNEEMDAIIEERDQALQDAESFEHDMIEAQDDLDAFKAAHLPIEGNWVEITLEYGEQESVEMAPVGNNDVEMMDPEEPEEPKDIDQD